MNWSTDMAAAPPLTWLVVAGVDQSGNRGVGLAQFGTAVGVSLVGLSGAWRLYAWAPIGDLPAAP
jgi:hypothetical protein